MSNTYMRHNHGIFSAFSFNSRWPFFFLLSFFFLLLLLRSSMNGIFHFAHQFSLFPFPNGSEIVLYCEYLQQMNIERDIEKKREEKRKKINIGGKKKLSEERKIVRPTYMYISV